MKKRRVDSTTKHEFESALLHLYKWLDYVDLEIGRSEGVFDELSVEEKKVVYEDTLVEMESHRSEYERVLEIGKQLIDELQTANVSFEEEESKIKNIENCWAATNDRLREIKKRIDYLDEVKSFRTELASLNLMLESYAKWFDTNKGNTQIEPFRVSSDITFQCNLIMYYIYISPSTCKTPICFSGQNEINEVSR